MEDGMQSRISIFIESFRLGLSHLVLAGLFYGSVAYFSGVELNENGSRGFVGHSGIVDIVSGSPSLLIMSIAVWYLRTNKMIYNIFICFLISAAVSIADYFLTMEFYTTFYATDNLNYSAKYNVTELFMC